MTSISLQFCSLSLVSVSAESKSETDISSIDCQRIRTFSKPKIMKINEKHSAIILERVFDCQDKYELIDMVSKRGKERTPIHRVILMAASKYFADLFGTNDSTEKPEEFVVDSDSEVIKSVVDFCYSGHIELTEQNVEKCLKIAIDGELDLLLEKCYDYFTVKLSSETVVDILSIAEKYNLDDLQQRASELLCCDLEHVPATQIRQLNPAMMLHLMENVDEAVSNDLLVKQLLSWFQYDETERGEHMPKMLQLIRLEQLSAKILSGTLEPLFIEFKCAELLYNEFKRRAMHPTPYSSSPLKLDEAATTKNNAVFLVANKWDPNDNTECSRKKLIVERFDASLNKFVRHYTSPWTEYGYSSYILCENKIFGIESRLSMVAYDLKTGEKEELLPMNLVRDDHTAILMGKSLYVFGGRDGNEYLSSCERYDTEKGTWEILRSMSRGRSFASAAILNGLIYVVGGYEHPQRYSPYSTLVESYDPKTEQWTERMPLDVGTFQARLVAFNELLYAFVNGGGVREYDPAENIWTKIQSNHLFLKVVSANGSLFALTYDDRFGQLTIENQRMNFAELTMVDLPRHFSSLSLQQCRYEE